MHALSDSVARLVRTSMRGGGLALFLTGAGISAESGIPTFRGPEGYWTVGSRNFRPEELATHAAFTRMPEEVWAWYLYRRSVCRAAKPNEAHASLVTAEAALGNRFVLVTQNVDGLHLRAGNSPSRTLQIHGNIDFMRCEDEYPRIRPLPDRIAVEWARDRRLGPDERAALSCCNAGRMARPHVLWFDESYDENLFKYESALGAAERAGLVVVIGTSGGTSLPVHIVRTAIARNVALLVVNADDSPFTEAAERSPRGAFLRGTATAWLPAIVREIEGATART